MKLKEIYNAAIETGIKNDPRGVKEVAEYLKNQKKKYNAMTEKQKKYFDTEKLTNPYADSRIVHDNNSDIKSMIVGIDMEVGELLLADRLNEKGTKIDAVFSHHPEGRGYANFYEVMDMQADIFTKYGVTISQSEALLEKRLKDVGEKVSPSNHYRTQGAAKLLDIPMISMHTPADNCVATFLQKKFDTRKPKRVSDVLDILMAEKEYKDAAEKGNPPMILVGSSDRKVNKVFVDMTGGTEGPKEIYEKLVAAGIDTIVGMHFSADHKKELQKININVVLAGHISSDNLGVNLLLDGIEKKAGKLKVYETSGFVRVKRA